MLGGILHPVQMCAWQWAAGVRFMSSAILAPSEEAIENRYRWTVVECHQMQELGLLEGRFEVLDGAVVKKMGQKPAHRMAIVLLTEWMSSVFGGRRVQVESPIAIPDPEG